MTSPFNEPVPIVPDPLPDSAIEARASGIHGSGVFAREAIPVGTVITEYTGEVIGLEEAERRERARQQRVADGATGESACDYLYIMNDHLAVDGRDSGNVARLINHRCETNCCSDVIADRVWILAERDIVAGEELSFDYGYTFRDGLGHPCRCGASCCVGYIVAKHQRWRVKRWLRREAEVARSDR